MGKINKIRIGGIAHDISDLATQEALENEIERAESVEEELKNEDLKIKAIAELCEVEVDKLKTEQSDLSDKVDSKQNVLVSGNNIKTVNGLSLVGSGNIDLATLSGSSSADTAPIASTLNFTTTEDNVVLEGNTLGGESIEVEIPIATTESAGVMGKEDKINTLLSKQATQVTQIIATADEAAKFIIREYIFTIGKEYRLINNSEGNVAATLLNDGVNVQSLNNNQGVIDKDFVFTASSNANAIRLYSQGNIDITIYPLESIHYLEEKNQEEFPKKVDKVYADSQHIVVNGVNGRYTRWAQDHTGWLAVTTGLTIKGTVTFGNIILSITSKDSAYNLKNNIVTIPIYTTYDGAQNVKCVTDFTGDIKLALDSNKRLVVLLGGNDYVWRICEIGIVNIDVWTNSKSISYSEYIAGEAINNIDAYTVLNSVVIERIASQSYVTEVVNKAKETFSQFESKNIELTLTSGYYNSELVAQTLNTWQKAEIDVSQYQGCLVKIKTKTRATDATGTVGWCGFVDSSGNKIHSFTGRYATSIMEDDVIILPIPRAFDAQNVDYASISYNGASKLRISTLKDFDCSVEIVTKCYDNRLRGKNIAVVGSSNAALYFNGECRINKGWFLYHLAPLFGYNCSVRNVGGSGWGDISRQFELCKQDIADTGKDYFDIVYLAETTNDGIGNFIDDYSLYIQGFCKELLYSGNESIDSGLNNYCKTAANSVKDIINHSPRARLYITMQFFNSNDYVEGKGALYLGQELKYENNFLKALCDVFNIKKISYCNGSSYRVWKEGPWYVWQGQSNSNTSDIKSSQQVLDQGDGIHASKPRGGWDQFKVFFSTLWNDMLCDSMFVI